MGGVLTDIQIADLNTPAGTLVGRYTGAEASEQHLNKCNARMGQCVFSFTMGSLWSHIRCFCAITHIEASARSLTWVCGCCCLEAGYEVQRHIRIDPVLGNPSGKVDLVWQVSVVGHHDIAQVLAFQAAAPPGCNQGVDLCTRADGNQGHRPCKQESRNNCMFSGQTRKWTPGKKQHPYFQAERRQLMFVLAAS